MRDLAIVPVQTATPQFEAYCAMRAQLWQIVESENLAEAHDIVASPTLARLNRNGLGCDIREHRKYPSPRAAGISGG
jgi:hypothetical protein